MRLPSRAAWRRTVLLSPLALLLLLFIATLPPAMPDPATVKAAWQPSESWLYDRNGRLLESVRVDFSQRRLGWVPLSRIAPALPRALIAAEDRRFLSHGGVDWLAVAGSIRDRLSGDRARGASTITMQLAGFLSPDLARPGARSLRQKARQMRAALALENHWSKDEILEAYLNLAGFRGEAQGVMAASRQMFGKTPASLSDDEARLLVALLPTPRPRPRKWPGGPVRPNRPPVRHWPLSPPVRWATAAGCRSTPALLPTSPVAWSTSRVCGCGRRSTRPSSVSRSLRSPVS